MLVWGKFFPNISVFCFPEISALAGWWGRRSREATTPESSSTEKCIYLVSWLQLPSVSTTTNRAPWHGVNVGKMPSKDQLLLQSWERKSKSLLFER